MVVGDCVEVLKVSPLKFLAFTQTLNKLVDENGKLDKVDVFLCAYGLYPKDRDLRFSLAWRHWLLFGKMALEDILYIEKKYFPEKDKIHRKSEENIEFSDAIIAAAAVSRVDENNQFNLNSLGAISAAFNIDFKGAIATYERMN